MDTLITNVDEIATWFVYQLAWMALAGSLLIAVSAVALRIFRTASASTRHFIWLVATIVPLLMPIASRLLPQCSLPALSASPSSSWDAASTARNTESDVSADIRGTKARSGTTTTEPNLQPSPFHGKANQPQTQVSSSNGSSRRAFPFVVASDAIRAWYQRASQRERSVPTVILLAAWGAGFAIFASRWIIGVIRLRGLGHRGLEPQAFFSFALADAKTKLGVRRPIRLRVSFERDSPMQWGIVHPIILLPAAAIDWDGGKIASVLRHELAHIRRGDCLTRALAHFASSVLWFNPLSWYGFRRLTRECELASDDVAINAGTDPCDYAETLLFISRLSHGSSPNLLPATGMASRSSLEGRVVAILAPGLNRGSVCRRTCFLFVVFAASVIGSLVVVQPRGAEARTTQQDTADESIAEVAGIHPSPQIEAAGRAITLSYVDDSAEGRKSIAGSGHAVRFERPRDSDPPAAGYLLAVEIFASRYGYEQPPAEDFHIYVLDDQQRLITALPIPYAKIQRSYERWYSFPISPTAIGEQFYVAFAFNPSRTKGVYVGYDEGNDQPRSYVGRPTSGLEPIREKRNWMIRAVIATEPRVANPFE